ncbi:MAG: hypothetical protein Q8N65_01540 [bacterium]|nr:hypothetical protein [bacterium]
MLTKLKAFVKDHAQDIVLATMVVLISLLSFAAGYLTAQYQQKEAILIESP